MALRKAETLPPKSFGATLPHPPEGDRLTHAITDLQALKAIAPIPHSLELFLMPFG